MSRDIARLAAKYEEASKRASDPPPKLSEQWLRAHPIARRALVRHPLFGGAIDFVAAAALGSLAASIVGVLAVPLVLFLGIESLLGYGVSGERTVLAVLAACCVGVPTFAFIWYRAHCWAERIVESIDRHEAAILRELEGGSDAPLSGALSVTSPRPHRVAAEPLDDP